MDKTVHCFKTDQLISKNLHNFSQESMTLPYIHIWDTVFIKFSTGRFTIQDFWILKYNDTVPKIIIYNTIIWRKNIHVLRMCASFFILILHEKNLCSGSFFFFWIIPVIKIKTQYTFTNSPPQTVQIKGKLIHILNFHSQIS